MAKKDELEILEWLIAVAEDPIKGFEADYCLEDVQELAVKAIKLINGQPRVVRCKDCMYWKNQSTSTRWLPCREMKTFGNWYCGSGRKASAE